MMETLAFLLSAYGPAIISIGVIILSLIASIIISERRKG